MALSLLVAACGTSSRAVGGPAGIHVQGEGPVPRGLQGVLQSPAQPKPAFTLTDTSGAPYALDAATQGDVTLLYFGYTHCPDECPTHMANIATALTELGPAVAAHVKVVFVTTDPRRDTGPIIRAWLDNFSRTFVGLTGTDSQLQSAETASGVQLAAADPGTDGTGNYSVSHAAQVIAFTDDNMAHVIYPSGLGIPAWEHDLPELVKGWPKA